jgi:biopolymer transport protein ExbB/biopolymer transport protein TolQ
MVLVHSLIAAALPILAQVHAEGGEEVVNHFSFDKMWSNMGWVAFIVALTLGVMSLISIGLFIERLLTYSKADGQSLRFAKLVTEHLMENKLGEAAEAADSKAFEASHVARVCSAGIREFLSGSQGNNDVVESARKSIERAIQTETLDLRRGLNALATVANTAPFVGLFGTVFGIINSFKSMATNESGGLAAIAGGISEALITTAFGLFVAVPAVWFFNYFSNRVETFSVDMNNSMLELLDYFEKNKNTVAADGGR